MLAKVGGKPKMEIPTYEGSLNAEELMDWINPLDKYFDYEEEANEKKKVKFSFTRLKGHGAIWWDELQTSRTRKGKSKIKQWDKMRLSIRAGHAEDEMEKVARYINGLRYDIQDEINLLSLKTIEDAYQASLKAEEKMLRKQNQRNRGRISVRGRGTTRPRGQQYQHEASSSSGRPPQRGEFNRGIFVPRGRGRGRDVRCYTCGEWGHVSWDCPHNKTASQSDVNVVEANPEPPRLMEKKESPEVGESLLLRRTLLKTEKEIEEPVQTKNLFRTTCKPKGKCCKVIINNGSTNNLGFTEMVDKIGIAKAIHTTPYKVSWL
eukprot:PITA_18546